MIRHLRALFLAVVAIATLTASTCSTSASCKRNPDGSIECAIDVAGHKHEE